MLNKKPLFIGLIKKLYPNKRFKNLLSFFLFFFFFWLFWLQILRPFCLLPFQPFGIEIKEWFTKCSFVVIKFVNLFYYLVYFYYLFYYLIYFNYYLWALLYFLILFIDLIILFQLTFTFIYNTFNKKISISTK